MLDEEGTFSLKHLNNMTPDIYKDEMIHFSYQFRPIASRYCVISQNTDIDVKKQSQPEIKIPKDVRNEEN